GGASCFVRGGPGCSVEMPLKMILNILSAIDPLSPHCRIQTPAPMSRNVAQSRNFQPCEARDRCA
ncbi:MAG: hypothetical protein JWO56_2925, partial [Acidobacteria bacterium]|nr:hypothetical protein [Acidobacteriota bacterium]